MTFSRLPERVRRRVRRGRPVWLSVPLLGFLVLVFGGTGPLAMWSYDLPFLVRRPAAPQPEVALLLLDPADLPHLGSGANGALRRTRMAEALDRLRLARVRLIVLDFLYQNSQSPADDEALARAIGACTNAGIPVVLAVAGTRTPLGAAIREEALPVVPIIAAATPHRGAADLDYTGEGHAVRRLTTRFGGQPTLAWTVARLLDAPVTRQPDAIADERWLGFYGPPRSRTLERFNLAQFLEGGVPEDRFRGRVVILGGGSEVGHAGAPLADEFAVPWSHGGGWPATGAEIHATAILNLLQNSWLERLGAGAESLLVIGWGLAVAILFVALRPPAAAAAAVGALAVAAATAIALPALADRWYCWLVPAAFQTPLALGLALWWNRDELGRPRVFLSYRREDGAPYARALRDALARRGIAAWLDVEDLDTGPFPDQLRRQVAATPAFLLVLTDGVLARLNQPGDWVAEEIRTARRHQRQLLVVRIPKNTAPRPASAEAAIEPRGPIPAVTAAERPSLPDDLADLTRLNAFRYDHHYFEDLMDDVRAAIIRGPSAG